MTPKKDARAVIIQYSHRTKPKGPSREHLEQKLVIDWRNAYRHKEPKLALLIAVPNAGKRSFGAARWLRDEGLTKGVPDLLLLCGDSEENYNYLAIEMKGPGGKLSDDQKACLLDIRDIGGGKVSVCFSGREAIILICMYLNLPEAWIPD